jgi:hypothetical protein
MSQHIFISIFNWTVVISCPSKIAAAPRSPEIFKKVMIFFYNKINWLNSTK